MTNEEAIRILRRLQEPEPWEPQINKAGFEALDLAIAALERDRWISVEERLPEEETYVLVARTYLGENNRCKPKAYVEVAYRICEEWVAFSDEYKANRKRHTDPYAWMPLPLPPKEET